MSRSPSPTPPKGSVRSIISIFENQTILVDNEPVNLLRRAKSLGSLSQRPTRHQFVERIEPEKDLELTQIEQQIRHLQNNLSNNYKTYSRESHIYYQNQIVFILTDLATVETRSNHRMINEKSELTEVLKRLNKKLNNLLPAEGRGETVIKETRPRVIVTKSSSVEERVASSSKKEKIVSAPKKQQYVRTVDSEDEIQVVVSEPRRQQYVRQVEPEDEVPVSVKSLKEIFEKNTTENEGKTEYGMTKITRKFQTFNGVSDLKYVRYSERVKTDLELDLDVRDFAEKKDTFVGFDEAIQNSFSSRQMVKGTDDEKEASLSPDSLSVKSALSDDDSDDEQSELPNADEELD